MAAVDLASATDLAALTGRVATNEGTLSAAAAAATPSTLAKRDAGGRLQVVGPAAAADAATKKYVDDGDTTAKAYADALGVTAATPSTIARRDAGGRLQVADPAVNPDAATKGYVDSSLTGFGRDLGVGTAFPAQAADGSALRRGDVYMHSTYGALFLWNGTGWRSRGPGELTSTQRAALVAANIPHAGFQVYETDTARVYEWIPAGVTVNGTVLAAGIWDQIGGPPEQYAIGYGGGSNYFASYTGAGYQGAIILKKGRECWFQGLLAPGAAGGASGTAMTAGTQYTVGTIPAQCAPLINDQGACLFYAGTGSANYVSMWVVSGVGGTPPSTLFFLPSVATASSTVWNVSLAGGRWRTNASS